MDCFTAVSLFYWGIVDRNATPLFFVSNFYYLNMELMLEGGRVCTVVILQKSNASI